MNAQTTITTTKSVFAPLRHSLMEQTSQNMKHILVLLLPIVLSVARRLVRRLARRATLSDGFLSRCHHLGWTQRFIVGTTLLRVRFLFFHVDAIQGLDTDTLVLVFWSCWGDIWWGSLGLCLLTRERLYGRAQA